LAHRTGITISAIAKIEKSQVRPSPAAQDKLSTALSIESSVLFDGLEPPGRLKPLATDCELAKVRKIRGLTTVDLARLTGLSFSMIAKYEKGVIPSRLSQAKIARALGVTVGSLFPKPIVCSSCRQQVIPLRQRCPKCGYNLALGLKRLYLEEAASRPSALRRVRLQRGWTQAGLAARSGLSAKQIGLIERGQVRGYQATRDRLAAALGLPVSELFRDAPHNFEIKASDSPLAQSRKRLGLTLAELSVKTGLSSSQLFELETGRQRPSRAAEQKLSAALNAHIPR
jgi:transcriptional regulator with XRE-family HTH domain